MKFGKILCSIMRSDWEHHYLNYKELKRQIKEMVRQPDAQQLERAPFGASRLTKVACHDAFMNLLHSELDRVEQFLGQLIEEKETHLHYVAIKLVNGRERWTPSVLTSLSRKTEAIADDVVKIAGFIYYNLEGFRKITKKYDKHFNGDSSRFFSPLLRNRTHLNNGSLDKLVMALSDMFGMIHDANTSMSSEPSFAAIESSVEVRKINSKYLVKAADVINVKVFIAKYLPIRIPGREDTTCSKLPCDLLKIGDRCDTSAVYFDNASFECYHDQLSCKEMAHAFRLTWSGNLDSPSPDQQVRVERTTHRGDVNREISLRSSEASAFLSGLVVPGMQADAVAVAEEIRSELIVRKLRPVLRTTAQRTVFQRGANDNIHVSIDVGLSFFDASQMSSSGDIWCRHLAREHLHVEDICMFPWAVLEISFVANPPIWLGALLVSGWLQEVEGFSKFTHGVATLHHNSAALLQKPDWFDSFHCDANASQSRKSKMPPFTRVSIERMTPASAHRSQSMSICIDSKADADVIELPKMGSIKVSDVDQCPNAISRRSRCWPSRTVVEGRRGLAKVEPKTYFANERTFIQWISPVMSLVAVALGLQGVGDVLGCWKVVWCGVALNCLAVVWMGFALYWYFHRLRKLERHDASGWGLRFGPVGLVLLLTMVCVASFVVMIYGPSLRSKIRAQFFFAPVLPLTAAQRWLQRGCFETPLLLDGVRPDAWEFHENLNPAVFATEDKRQSYVRRWEATMGQFAALEGFTVTDDTVQRLCVEGSDCRNLSSTYLYVAPTEISTAFTMVGWGGSTVSPDLAAASQTKIELSSSCGGAHLVSSYITSAGGRVRAPVSSARVASIHPVDLLLLTSYDYELKPLFEAHTVVSLRFGYLSEDDRAFGENATSVEVAVQLKGSVTRSSIVQAEGLLEALLEASGSLR